MLGFTPADCVVVEDAPSGVSAGLAAGCRVLGVLGTHEASELGGASWATKSLDAVALEVLPEGLRLRFEAVED
jgi:sugar-phosphatase